MGHQLSYIGVSKLKHIRLEGIPRAEYSVPDTSIFE